MTETMTEALQDDSSAPAVAARADDVEVVMFTLGDEQLFAIDVFELREVVRRPPPHTSHARTLPAGSCSYRGQSLPVIDLAAAFGYPPLCDEESASVLVTSTGGVLRGFLVLDAQRMLRCPAGTLEAPDSALGFGARVHAVTRLGSKLLALVDLSQVLAGIDFRPADPSTVDPAARRVRRPSCVLVSDNSKHAAPARGSSQWR